MLWAHTPWRYGAAPLAGLMLALIGLGSGAGQAMAASPPPNADLAIVSITPDVPQAKVGDNVTFTIVARNNGPDPAELFVRTVESSASLAGGSVTCYGVNETPGPTNSGPSPDGPECEYRVVQPGDTVTDTVVARVEATGSKAAVDTTCVDAPDVINDPDLSNNCATATVVIDGPLGPPRVDLAIASDTPSVTRAAVGQDVTFTIVATNNGPDPAAYILVHALDVWEGLKFVSATCSGNGAWGRIYGACEEFTVRPGDIATVTIVGQVQGTGGEYASDTACVSSVDPIYDPDPADDCGTAIVRIDNPTTDGTGTTTGTSGGTAGGAGNATSGSGGTTGPVASLPQTGAASVPAGTTACLAYTRRIHDETRIYTIRVHGKLSCGKSRTLIRQADERFAHRGTAVKVSSWLCTERRSHNVWMDTCTAARNERVTWTETSLGRS